LLSIVDASICPSNFDWDNFFRGGRQMHATKCSSYLFTNKSFESSVEDIIIKEYGFLEDAHLLWNAIKFFFRDYNNTRLR
jgi:hypothetical protein